MASIPVAAVTCLGRPSVNVASSTAQSAINGGELTASLTPPSQVTTDIGVASEPVPAVVGTSASGNRRPCAMLTPQISSRTSPEPSRYAASLATSIGLPPPTATTDATSA